MFAIVTVLNSNQINRCCMRKVIISFLAVVLGLTTLHAQSDRSDRFKSNNIFFAPLNLFDFVTPSMQIGYEKIFGQQIGVQIEGGYLLNRSLIGASEWFSVTEDELTYKRTGYKIRAELKFYLNSSKKAKPYVALEGYYTKCKLTITDTDNLANYDPSDNEYADYYYINDKERLGGNVKFGLKFFAGPYVTIEPYAGLGIVKRTIVVEGNSNVESIDGFGTRPSENVDDFQLNVPFNVKIGFRF